MASLSNIKCDGVGLKIGEPLTNFYVFVTNLRFLPARRCHVLLRIVWIKLFEINILDIRSDPKFYDVRSLRPATPGSPGAVTRHEHQVLSGEPCARWVEPSD